MTDGKMTDGKKPHELASAEDVEAAVREIYGTSFLGTGVIHPTSVWRRDAATHLTLRIGPETPSSPYDQLALGLARARADAIVTTGKILRDEPELDHSFPDLGALAAGLAAWRAESLRKKSPPIRLVLTSGKGLSFDHPFFRGAGRTVILTDRRGAWGLESRAADAGVEVVALDSPTPRDAVDLLRSEFGCATVSIEAGPSVSRQYYEEPVIVDELLLSVYAGDPPPPAARGRRQVPPDQLEVLLRRPAPPFTVPGGDGWELHRYLRD